MQIFRHHNPLPDAVRGGVVAVGNFDGVHRGHRIVVEAARAEACRLDVPSVVLSFEPHPRAVFAPNQPPFRLTPFRIRARLLEALKVDVHVVLHFDLEFARIPAERFIEEVLVGGLGARHVVIGYDFCFGHKRGGNAATLEAFGQKLGFGVTIVTQASDEHGGVLSSSRVRDFLVQGHMREAAEILGRAWTIEGRVEPGDRRGRKLGIPTANIDLGEYLRPAFGVYAVRAAIDEEEPLHWWNGVANLGIRPMWPTENPLLEVHLFDFSGDLYGRHLRVELVERLRGEAKFDGVDQLMAQVSRDIAEAKAVLARAQ